MVKENNLMQEVFIIRDFEKRYIIYNFILFCKRLFIGLEFILCFDKDEWYKMEITFFFLSTCLYLNVWMIDLGLNDCFKRKTCDSTKAHNEID